ncbi:glycosyl transferase family 28 [Clostridium saudiense]|nr:glycosyl transferase family 28 [Clostridium saudiense]
MIFITVGTHEQGLDRLLVEIDNLIERGIICEEVFAQIGYSEYQPKHYDYKRMIGYDEVDSCIKNARIVITHGGPGSIFQPLQYNKIPIVVPRDPEFSEHVDNHQILFARRLEKQNKIIAVYDIKRLEETIKDYDELIINFDIHSTGTEKFIKKFAELIDTKLF